MVCYNGLAKLSNTKGYYDSGPATLRAVLATFTHSAHHRCGKIIFVDKCKRNMEQPDRTGEECPLSIDFLSIDQRDMLGSLWEIGSEYRLPSVFTGLGARYQRLLF